MSLFKYSGIMQAMKEDYTVNTGARKGMVNCTAWKGEGVRQDFIKDGHILAASWKMKSYSVEQVGKVFQMDLLVFQSIWRHGKYSKDNGSLR